MHLIRGLHNLKTQFGNGCVATIGNYDGVHLGHQQILTRLQKKAEELKMPSVVITFMPQPEEFFTGDRALLLTSLREKIFLFTQYGVDEIVVLVFNSHFAAMGAARFVEKILVQTMHVCYLIIGDDFSFGHERRGSFALLNQYANCLNFKVERVPAFKTEGVRVSSSLLRAALLQGDLKTAARFLGRSYQVSGRVIHGNSLGRNLGFPTANIYLAQRGLPLQGVYAVKIHGIAKSHLYGVANIGFRPTFLGQHKSFEVYIFDFADDIYGKKIMVEFWEKIRDEQKFPSIKDLQLQIAKDLKKAKKILGVG